MIHDVTKGLPFEPDCFEAIYSSHLLEHLYLADAQRLLAECFRVLAPGGVLRVIVPDLRGPVREYVARIDRPRLEVTDAGESSEGNYAADRLLLQLLMRPPVAPSGSIFYRLYTTMKDFHTHKWMYDPESLSGYFRQAHFVDVEEMFLNSSRISDIERIEKSSRICDGAGICIEGVKPRSLI
jgi:SAM-dependent methyltransferase